MDASPVDGKWRVRCAVVLAVTVVPWAAGPRADAADGIVISVLNAADRKPIREFRVLAGVPAGSVSEEFTRRTGGEVVNWQPHTVRVGEEGRFIWPTARGYDQMALRVEAEGYQPQRSAWIKKANLPQQVEFLLVRDAGTHGRVFAPDGAPAADATIALALPQKDAVIEHGRIRRELAPLPEKESDRWRRPTMVKSDAEGRFVLPPETDLASAVLVVHESGVRELPALEFQKRPIVTLLPWGRVEGQVLWKDKPGANETVSLSIFRNDYGYPGMIGQYAEVTTDAEGRFAFDKVLPGHVGLSRSIQLPQEGQSGIRSVSFSGLGTHTTVRPGDLTPVVIGGQGRLVTGRLTGRDSWEGVTMRMHPNAPHFGFPGDDDRWRAFGAFRSSAIGPLFFRDKLQPNADGTFTIPNMLPGYYQLFVSAPGVENYAASTTIRVDPEQPGQPPPPLELGEIPVESRGVKPGGQTFSGKFDGTQELVVRVDRGEDSLEWRSGGPPRTFEVIVEASPQIPMGGGRTGMGFVITTKMGTGESVANVALTDGNFLVGTLEFRAKPAKARGRTTFADLVCKDGKKLPVSFGVEPKKDIAARR